MTEERFEQIVEDAADRFDKAVNRAWKHRPVRIIGNGISFLAAIALIASALPLAEKGYHTWAKVCFIGGCIVIIAEIAKILIFKKK